MVPSLGMVVEWLDESTLGLLFGMMIIVGRLKDTGGFLMRGWMGGGGGGHMLGLLCGLVMISGNSDGASGGVYMHGGLQGSHFPPLCLI